MNGDTSPNSSARLPHVTRRTWVPAHVLIDSGATQPVSSVGAPSSAVTAATAASASMPNGTDENPSRRSGAAGPAADVVVVSAAVEVVTSVVVVAGSVVVVAGSVVVGVVVGVVIVVVVVASVVAEDGGSDVGSDPSRTRCRPSTRREKEASVADHDVHCGRRSAVQRIKVSAS